MGVVIGEIAVIGNNIVIYHGVTLWGTGKENKKRHPTIEDNVMIGPSAKILGNITIGENSKIGAGSVVLNNISKDSTVVGVAGKIVDKKSKKIDEIINILKYYSWFSYGKIV